MLPCSIAEHPIGRQGCSVSASVVAYNTDPGELSVLLGSLRDGSARVLATVVDNSATNALQRVVEDAGALYVHSGSNVGYGAGHNIALRRNLHRTRYQLVLNPDIVLERDTIASLVAFMELHPDVGQLMPAVRYPDGSEQRLTKRLPTPADLFLRRFAGPVRTVFPGPWERYEMRDIDLSVPSEVPCLSGCFMLMRSSVLERTGLFDERFFMYMEDVDLCRRIGAVSRTVFYPDVAVTHGYAKGSYRNPRLMRMHLRSAVQYFGKWGWIFDQERRSRNRRTNCVPPMTPALTPAAKLKVGAL